MYKVTNRTSKSKSSFSSGWQTGNVEVNKQKEKVSATKRAIWKGSIVIGLINVPVKLYSMLYNRGVKFHYLHRTDNHRLRYERICSLDEQVVPWGEVVKGYEVAHNKYVVFDLAELEAAKPESNRRVRIDKFVDYFAVDPIYFYRNYILTPDKSEEAYSLLFMALSQMGKAGAGRITLREKEYPVLIHSYKDALVLTTLRYAYDVVDPSSFEELNRLALPERNELNLAKKIIAELSGDFDITEYEDTFRLRIAEMVQKKLNGEPIIAEPESASEDVKGLMAALQQTLRQIRHQ